MSPEIALLPVFQDLPGIRAFFTTRSGGVSTGPYASLNLGPFSGDEPESVRQNWIRLLDSQGWAGRGLALPRLCHGANAVEVAGASLGEAFAGIPGAQPENADAVHTREENWVLAVTMADCLPALIADPITRCVAAVHAGWRGTRDRILERTLKQLFAAGHCDPVSTHVALGPCLSLPALEISGDVAAALPPEHIRETGGRYYFDLRGDNRAQALRAGVPAGNIGETGGCTREDSGLFFSHRRDAGQTGRMAACITLV